MSKWITIAPILDNYNVLAQESFKKVDMGNNVYIDNIPDKLRGENITKHLSFTHKREMEDAISMFISEYEAKSLGDPDPDWKSENKRGKQRSALEKIQISNLSLWLVQPSPLAFDLVFHIDDRIEAVRQSFSTRHIIHHQRDTRNYHSKEDLEAAKDISVKIQKLSRDNSLWLATRTLFEALTSTAWETRFLLLWISLEALFGVHTEVTYRLSHRISFFLSDDRKIAADITNNAKNSYNWRSRIIHGESHKLNRGESEQILYETERFIRDSLLKIFKHDSLSRVFTSKEKQRNEYLDQLVFK